MRRLAALALLVAACSALPATSASATAAQWSCRLPVMEGTPGQGGGPQSPGFLTLPGLAFSPDPHAGDGMFYNKQLARWVPSGPPALSGDGASYAYVDGDQSSSRIHLVDMKTGRDVVVASGGPWRIVGLQPEAVYVMRIEYLPESPAYGVLTAAHGLWKVPLDGGAPAQLTSDGRSWTEVAAGAAWGGGSPLDVAGGPNDIVRLDLLTRQVTTWFAPGKRSRLVAVDATGAALIMAEAANDELWRVAAPGDAVKVWSGTEALRPDYPVAVDGKVVWFSSSSQTSNWAIFRYSDSRGVELVANFADRRVTVAGPCA